MAGSALRRVRVGCHWPVELSAANPGSVNQLLVQLRRLLEQTHEVEFLPERIAWWSEPERSEAWQRFFSRCRVAIVPCIYSAEAFRRRARLGARTRFVYLPLGELPRRARFLRQALPFFRRGDVIAFSSRADQKVFDALVEICPARRVQLAFGVDTSVFRPAGRG